MTDIDEGGWMVWSDAHEEKRLQRLRRERIATACLAAVVTSSYKAGPSHEYAAHAVCLADALIAELDKEE